MIREKGEALSPVEINRNVWSNSAVQVKGLFTESERLLLVTVTDWREQGEVRKEGGRKRGEDRGRGARWKKSGKSNTNTRERKGT